MINPRRGLTIALDQLVLLTSDWLFCTLNFIGHCKCVVLIVGGDLCLLSLRAFVFACLSQETLTEQTKVKCV